MEISINYDGASIEILEKDDKKNTIIVSPKMENNAFSNYFNFKVKNNSEKFGTIYIKNINNLLYKSKIIPFVRKDRETFKHIDDNKYEYTTESIKILIDANEELEISSYPRYVEEDLNNFINSIKNEFVSVDDGIVKKIIIGDKNKNSVVVIGRQHPGETLSSYFIEGIITEIANSYKNYDNNCFVFFPIVSNSGVKNGNYRYTENFDLNREWNSKGKIKELDYIKEELKKYNIDYFVDVHGDEITKFDYIRMKKANIDSFCDIKIIEDQTKIKRFFRALIKQGRIINLTQMTAREYITKKYRCKSMLIELSLNNNNIESSKIKGREFAKNLKRSIK